MIFTKEHIKKLSQSHMGMPLSEEHRKSISRAVKKRYADGEVPWNKGLKQTEEHKLMMSEMMKKRPNSGWFKKGMTSWLKGKKLTKEQIKNSLRRRKMSSLELKMDTIIKKNELPYKFVGNGDFFIERKNPDFVNINGEKKAVEVFYRKHKEMFRGNIDSWKKEREFIFNKYGWKLYFFDETQVTEYNVIRSLTDDTP